MMNSGIEVRNWKNVLLKVSNIYLSLSSRTNSHRTPSLIKKVVATNLKDGSVLKLESKIVNFTVGYLAEISTFSNSFASTKNEWFFKEVLFLLTYFFCYA